jgi:hypothetical protein
MAADLVAWIGRQRLKPTSRAGRLHIGLREGVALVSKPLDVELIADGQVRLLLIDSPLVLQRTD